MYLKRIYISTTLLACFMLTAPWSALAQDEQKSNNRNSQSLSTPFGAGGSSPNNDIYIDDEGLEGSGSRGEIRDDLEKEDDESSGSGYGDDDEDSSSSSSSRNSNTNLGAGGSKDKSRISENSAGGSVPIGKDTSKQSGTSITHGGQTPDGDLEISHTQHITPTDVGTGGHGHGHDSTNPYGGSGVLIMNAKNEDRTASFFAQPGILAAVIGGAVVGLLCAILVVMFIVYRMRKKDEGSYALDEPKRSPTANTYAKNANNREFYA
ncbi:syndecan isoform X2 [Topomyia yanbarensis]|uniref:syndecan isoform X2 n=1 Tax=Topomyia yanbarensis TaxID=2498891 RepID=UPI00273CCE31|nr:syndecan isoform X2 [Topomyia yanbarensis]